MESGEVSGNRNFEPRSVKCRKKVENIFWKRAACDGIKGSNKFIYLKNIIMGHYLSKTNEAQPFIQPQKMQVIYEKIERRPNYEIFIDFRCICNGLDIVTFGTIQMMNVDYDKHLSTSAASIDSEEDADNVMFSSLPDEVYDYIDEKVEALKDEVFD